MTSAEALREMEEVHKAMNIVKELEPRLVPLQIYL
jgi:hypothetical protein